MVACHKNLDFETILKREDSHCLTVKDFEIKTRF